MEQRDRQRLVGAVDDAFLRSVARDDPHLALLRELAPTSYAVPLPARPPDVVVLPRRGSV